MSEIDIREVLHERYQSGHYRCVVTKLAVLKKLQPTDEQLHQTIEELDADLVELLPHGYRSAMEAQGLYEILEDRLVMHIHLMES